jgi:hypothetical protein
MVSILFCILSSIFFFLTRQLHKGTSIGVFGTYGSNPPQSMYVLDDASPVTFMPPNTTTELYRQSFYQSPTLPDGAHNLTIIFTAPPEAWFWLDYLQYTPPQTASTSVASATATSSGSPASLSHRGAIAGGVVGGIAALALFALLFFLLGRRRRRKRAPDLDLISTCSMTQLKPFLTLMMIYEDDTFIEVPVHVIAPFTATSLPDTMAETHSSKHLFTSSITKLPTQPSSNLVLHNHRDSESLSSNSSDELPSEPHLHYNPVVETPPAYTN